MALTVDINSLRATIIAQQARIEALTGALEGMLAEWDKLTRYGSPLVKAANENVNRARSAISEGARS